jgi:Glycosyl hydrolase family 76
MGCATAGPQPGVFWVEQGRGRGLTNHDRNTVSNAPNAQLGLHLNELLPGAGAAERAARAHDMYAWVNSTLDAARARGESAAGLFFDKVRGDGSIDETLWTYNQGSMIGANLLLARAGSEPAYLARAEAIARTALTHYADTLEHQPPAFNAILFRNLLQLHAATRDAALRRSISSVMAAYADAAWHRHRDRHDRFRFSRRGVTLLDQSAMVQVYALLAWDPAHYAKLA